MCYFSNAVLLTTFTFTDTFIIQRANVKCCGDRRSGLEQLSESQQSFISSVLRNSNSVWALSSQSIRTNWNNNNNN